MLYGIWYDVRHEHVCDSFFVAWELVRVVKQVRTPANTGPADGLLESSR